mmetsp:Transcript_26566/g.67521  ORF Transcript_26566/g.67521 Transcript_26566/m.67521 type:complete len:256 (+) Transcript_26566:323-1090(+)
MPTSLLRDYLHALSHALSLSRTHSPRGDHHDACKSSSQRCARPGSSLLCQPRASYCPPSLRSQHAHACSRLRPWSESLFKSIDRRRTNLCLRCAPVAATPQAKSIRARLAGGVVSDVSVSRATRQAVAERSRRPSEHPFVRLAMRGSVAPCVPLSTIVIACGEMGASMDGAASVPRRRTCRALRALGGRAIPGGSGACMSAGTSEGWSEGGRAVKLGVRASGGSVGMTRGEGNTDGRRRLPPMDVKALSASRATL